MDHKLLWVLKYIRKAGISYAKQDLEGEKRKPTKRIFNIPEKSRIFKSSVMKEYM